MIAATVLNAPQSTEEDALAVAYASGRREALSPLLTLLWPMVGRELAALRRRVPELPATIDRADLEQEAVVIVARLAERWDPDLGHVGAFVRRSLPWELWRFVRRLSPTKRAAAVRVDAMDNERLIREADRLDTRREDGRRWLDAMIVRELLAQLDPLARRVVALHVLEDLTLAGVASAAGISEAAAHRAYRRGCDTLRFALRRELPGNVDDLVTVLHRHARPSGRLPGRALVCREAGLSEVGHARLMRQLVERGCIVSRSPRSAGRLAHPTPDATLAALRS